MNVPLLSSDHHYGVSVRGAASGVVAGEMYHRLVITERAAANAGGRALDKGVYFPSFGNAGDGLVAAVSFSDAVFLDIMKSHVALAEFGMMAEKVHVPVAMVEKIVKADRPSARGDFKALLFQVAAQDHFHSPFLAGVREVVSNESPAEMSALSLAGRVGMSTAHFSRRFSREVGVSPSAYLREMRLAHARSLLICGAMPLVDIAMECGFADQPHFTRVFKKRFGITPAGYAKKFAISSE